MKPPVPSHLHRCLPVLAMLSGAALLAGCSSTHTAFRNLNQDIPPELVQQYRESKQTDIEKRENFFLPLLSSSKAQLTKTESGFRACRKGKTVLGLVTTVKEEASYSGTGTLLEYNYNGTLVTGLLHGRDLTRTKEDNGYRYAKKWSTLWGLIHFNNQSVKSNPAL